ncbi:hypothetical protein Tco_1166093 [Tanacetum coccineum]
MTGNMERLDDFQKFQGEKVTFGGGEGRITRKGTIRTPTLDVVTKAFDEPRVINSPCSHNKELASPEQTATGKDRLIKSTHVAEVVPKSIAGSSLPAASSTRFMCSSQDSSRLDVAVKFIFQSSRYVVPTGRVIVPAGKVIIIVSPGRVKQRLMLIED